MVYDRKSGNLMLPTTIYTEYTKQYENYMKKKYITLSGHFLNPIEKS
jgi:hypothetical protein